VALHHRLRLAGRPAGEQPDRGVVLVTRECLELVRRALERAHRRGLAGDDDLLEVHTGGAPRSLEDGGGVAMDHRDNGARVAAEVFDRVEGQLRVDHHDHRANFECAEQRRHELRPIGQRDDHALFGLHAGALEQMTEAVRERLHVAVGVRPVIRQQRRPVGFAFPDARIQQPISDV